MGCLSGVGGRKRGPNERGAGPPQPHGSSKRSRGPNERGARGVPNSGGRPRENALGKKKQAMERKSMGEEDAEHFLLERKTMGEEEGEKENGEKNNVVEQK